MSVERVPVNVDQLVNWCAKQDRPIDSSARAEFAVYELQRLHSQDEGPA